VSFFAAGFFTADFFTADFFGVAFLAAAFFAVLFFAAGFRADFFTAVVFAAVFFPVFFTAPLVAVRDVLGELFFAVALRRGAALRALLFFGAAFFAAVPVLRLAFDADLRALVLAVRPFARPAPVFVVADFFVVDPRLVVRFAEREAPALREAVRAARLSVFFAVPVLRPFFAAILTSMEGVRRCDVSHAHGSHSRFGLYLLP